TSSAKYKNNITDLGLTTDAFMNLRPVSFKWNELTGTPGKLDFGLIAEEVIKISPEFAILNPDGTPEGVSYHNVNIMAIKVIQSQHKEIESLKERLRYAEDKINEILTTLK
ncbi:MAG: tail fiber domain-containing protein, partial [Bacteroidales bacterium]|nr:tail fiber domain-containing protein [Bacteroidales bacterium]